MTANSPFWLGEDTGYDCYVAPKTFARFEIAIGHKTLFEKDVKSWALIISSSCLFLLGGSLFLLRSHLFLPSLAAAKHNASVSSKTIIEGQTAEQIDAFMQDLESQGYAGAVVIEKNGTVILTSGYGWADHQATLPVTIETAFDIGSVTKQFTAAAILKLEEQGLLRVEDSISLYLDAVPADKQDITLHQLLTHTAGFPEGLGDDYEPILREAYVERAMGIPLERQPGEAYSYSNAGYSILAVIIEIVSGQSYEAYLREHLLAPAGMMQTGYLLPNWEADKLAHGYGTFLGMYRDTGTPLDYRFAEDGPYWNLRGNGGLLSTALDMYNWHKALQNNTILSEVSKEKLFMPYVSEGHEEPSFYGYGWVVMSTLEDTTLQIHDGGNGIFSAEIRRYVDDDVMVFITSSVARFDAPEVGWQIDAILLD